MGMHPTSFLKKRRKCCGYWKPLHVVVQFLARDKLAFVETHAVVEQNLDVRDDQRLGELVDRMLRFTAASPLENCMEDRPTSVTVIIL